jgi:regulator of replication initiation timing
VNLQEELHAADADADLRCQRSNRSGDLQLVADETGAVLCSPLHPDTPHLTSPIKKAPACCDERTAAEQPQPEAPASPCPQGSNETGFPQAALAERCRELAAQSEAFKEQCRNLMLENHRLKSLQATAECDDVIAGQLALQVQSLMQEKARIMQEKQWLEKENGNLQQLLEFACANMRAESPVEGDLPNCALEHAEACPTAGLHVSRRSL